MTRFSTITKFVAAAIFCSAVSLSACGDDNKGGTVPGTPDEPDPTPGLPELPVPGEIHTYKAPLYWTIYEYAREW